MKITLIVSYLVLIVVAVACGAFYILFPLALEGWRGFSLNLATEVLGILLTVVLIDTVIRRRDERERMRYRSIALRQLRSSLLQHAVLFFNMYKAAVEQNPGRTISTVGDLFDVDYFEQTKLLDLMKPAPGIPPMRWGDYLNQETQRFKESLERMVDKYAAYLDSETVDVAAQLVDSDFILLFGWFPKTFTTAPEESQYESYSLGLYIGNQLRGYATAFSKLVDIYNKDASEGQQVLYWQQLWRNNVEPKIGSARIASKS